MGKWFVLSVHVCLSLRRARNKHRVRRYKGRGPFELVGEIFSPSRGFREQNDSLGLGLGSLGLELGFSGNKTVVQDIMYDQRENAREALWRQQPEQFLQLVYPASPDRPESW